ncbi:hypothetical protein [Halorhodospira abdelmalekii]|uniref:hypothetical protein n=1 Tax=Halorhodospira abdelmalekii TaxID=421629 RepID=UPI001906FB8A|nr:hypothetical protein [Halorhodospira abdelmalekii]
MRFFNTEGPVRPEMHYVLPPLGRWNEVDALVGDPLVSLLRQLRGGHRRRHQRRRA